MGALTEKSSVDILILSTASLEVGRAAFGIVNTRGSIPVWFLNPSHEVLNLFLQKVGLDGCRRKGFD
jgi:hypothetical protein